jgi:glycosyltransferase involved in cell wall biosynthesis
MDVVDSIRHGQHDRLRRASPEHPISANVRKNHEPQKPPRVITSNATILSGFAIPLTPNLTHGYDPLYREMKDHSARIVVVCPEYPSPSGGVRKMYRHVDVLIANGIPAVILHQQPGFRCQWFESRTAVAYPGDAWPPAPSDILLVPELFIWQFIEQAPGTPKVVFNQNAYQTFRGHSIAHQTMPYGKPDCLASIVVSEDSRRYLEFAFADHRVFRIHNSVNPALFCFQPDKKRRVAFMPRKNSSDAMQVINLLNCRGKLRGYQLVPIEGKSELETAQTLRESMIFLSFGFQEGWSMPSMEAMACGCVTIGYDGRGGREFFDSRHAIVVEPQDVIGFADSVETAISRLDDADPQLCKMARDASEFVLRTYTPQREEEDIVATWRQILQILEVAR